MECQHNILYLLLLIVPEFVLSEFYNVYECNTPLLHRAALKATSSMSERGPENAIIDVVDITIMTNKSVRWIFNFSAWQPTHSEIMFATSCVQPEEKERLAKFVFKKDFKSSLIGRLMMRKCVTELTNMPYNQIQFVRDDKGKPVLANKLSYPHVNFNVSHQGDYTVLVGSNGDHMLGVDVMKVEFPQGKSLTEYFRIMSRIFSQNEWSVIKGAGNDNMQLAMFCRHWCLKESYLKAVGVGITINLQDLCFKVNTKCMLSEDNITCDTKVYFQGKKLEWEFQEMLLDQQHCVAVAVNSTDVDKTAFKEIDYDDLMKNAVRLLAEDEPYCRDFFKKLDK